MRTPAAASRMGQLPTHPQPTPSSPHIFHRVEVQTSKNQGKLGGSPTDLEQLGSDLAAVFASMQSAGAAQASGVVRFTVRIWSQTCKVHREHVRCGALAEPHPNPGPILTLTLAQS